jgi:AcrR family transcriptional regulator
MARKIRDPAALDRIVDAAATVVASQGVHGASIRVIAAEAGVSTGFITHYFADKSELMERLLTETNLKAARRVTRAIAAEEAPLEQLRAAVDALLPLDAQRRREWQVWVAVWGEASQGGDLAAGYRAGWAGLRAIFVGLLRDAQSAGKLDRRLDIEHRAERLVTLLAGIGLLTGVEKPARVRARARQMLDEELDWLGAPVRLAS